MQKRCGTPGYVAPEVILSRKYGVKCDIFSSGVLLYFVISGRMLFRADKGETVMNNTIHRQLNFSRHARLESLSSGCKTFMSSLLTKQPERRPTAQEALSLIFDVPANFNSNPSSNSDTSLATPRGQTPTQSRVNSSCSAVTSCSNGVDSMTTGDRMEKALPALKSAHRDNGSSSSSTGKESHDVRRTSGRGQRPYRDNVSTSSTGMDSHDVRCGGGRRPWHDNVSSSSTGMDSHDVRCGSAGRPRAAHQDNLNHSSSGSEGHFGARRYPWHDNASTSSTGMDSHDVRNANGHRRRLSCPNSGAASSSGATDMVDLRCTSGTATRSSVELESPRLQNEAPAPKSAYPGVRSPAVQRHRYSRAASETSGSTRAD